jgi:hypothetical protein
MFETTLQLSSELKDKCNIIQDFSVNNMSIAIYPFRNL